MVVAKSEVLIFDSQLLAERDYWKDKLSGLTAASSLRPDYDASPTSSSAKAVVQLQFPDSVVAKLRDLTSGSRFLIYTAVLAAAKICLHKYSGDKTIVVGSPALKELGRANTLAIVTDIDTEMTFRQLLMNLRETLLEAYARQRYPFDYLIRDLELENPEGRHPLFDLIVRLKDIHVDIPELRSDLTLSFESSNTEIFGLIEFNPNLYSQGTIAVFADHLLTVLEEALGNKDRRLVDFQMLTANERQRVLGEWNQTAAPYVPPLCLHQIFEAQVERSPHAVAIQALETQLSYAELNVRANQLAHFLRRQGIGAEVPVGICLERSVEMVVALLAVLKAGGAYVPLDPAYPLERLRYVIEEINAPIVLTQTTVSGRLPAHWGLVVCVDQETASFASFAKENPENEILPENLAYVIYTSGSTGNPKGVMVPHAGLCNVAAAQSRIMGLEQERVLQFASLGFDASIADMLLAWGSGGTVCLVPQNSLPLGLDLHQLLIDYAVTTVTLPPTALMTLPDGEFPALSTLTVAGESCPAELVDRWAPGRRFFNLYGPTEATIWCTSAECTAGAGKPTIGRPIDNVEVYILDARKEPVPVGVAGELHIGGVGLARGYWGRPDLTAEKFVPHPHTSSAGARLYRTGDVARFRSDGQIDFLGRMDHQVKVRGFRIELGEIEAVLKQHSGVQDAIAIVREDRPDEKRIVGYVVPKQQPAPTADELLDYLKARVPDFMCPHAFVTLEQMPLSPNGKIDRRMLPAPDQGRPGLKETFVEPAGETQQTLARVWSEVLQVELIGAHDNFFALGGDSILAIQVVARTNQAGLRLQPKHLFEHPTIAGLALIAGTATEVEAEQGIVSGPVPLTAIQHWFFEQPSPEPHHYNQSVMLEAQESLDLTVLSRAAEALLSHHDALRMRFTRDAETWSQFNASVAQRSAVDYFDLSNVADEQLSQTIAREANKVQASLDLTSSPLLRVALFDCGADRPDRLLIVVHHLVVDGVSWRIMLNDLQTAFDQAMRGESIDLGRKTTSFKYWAERLVDYAQSGALDNEKSYWLETASQATRSLPVDLESGDATIESAQRVLVSLTTDETKALLQEVPETYNTQINDVLLTAVLQAFHDWTGERSLLLTLEGHGREEIVENVDLSRTVGWFTTEYPVFLSLEEARSTGEALCLVKEQLRAIPQRGIGYGLLRYLGDDETRTQLSQLIQPEVSFNYLGQFDQVLSESSLFRSARESKGQTQSRHGNMPHLLQINGNVAAGRLQLSLTYSEKVFQPATIERFGASLETSLRALISHCQLPEAGGFTPSDFPLTSLTQSELNLVAGSDKQIEDIYPLTPFQQGLLFHALYAPGSDVYFMQLGATIEEQQLDAASFRRAWQRLVDLHQILRTAFVWEGVSEPLQVVRQHVTLPWQELDWRDLSETEQKEQLTVFLKNDERRGFVHSEAPLMRCTLIRLADDTYRFVWSVHHLLLDGWATMHVVKELFDFYDAFAGGKDLSPAMSRPFRDYIAWLQQQDQAKAETFWRTRLAGFTSPTPMAIVRQDFNQDAKEEYFDQRWQLSRDTSDALKEFARGHHLTLNTIVQGMFGLLLSRYSGTDDVVFGATVSGRPATLLGVESMVGVFLNTLPVRVRISQNDTLISWLKQLQEQQADAQQYEYTPLLRVQAWSDVPRGTSLFETILIFENYPIDASLRQRREGLILEDVSSIDRANYPLAFGASPGAQLHFRVSYDRRVYEDETIARMFGHLQTLLEAVLANPEQRLVDLPLLTDAEQQKLLVEWNETATPSPPQLCLHELFETQVRRFPEAMALWTPEAHLSYAELNSRANRLAHFLRKQGVGPEVLVGICMERSWEMVVSMLAVLKAGGAYVPLDPEYPLERLRYMMEEINAWVVLTQGRLAERLPAHWGQVVCVDEEWESFDSYSDENPGINVNGDNLANLIYTSGSTGTPKASMVTHRGLCNTILHRIEAVSLNHEDRVLQTHSFSFDASVCEFFAPFAIGAELVMLRPGGLRNPAYIVDMLVQHRITTVGFPPSLLRMILEEPALDRCTDLKHVTCGGQILTGELQERFHTRLKVPLTNYYGPSEASIDTSRYTCEGEVITRTAPIGRPIGNVQVYILDSWLRPVPIGVRGELHIGGDGVARGYLNQAPLTAEKFIPNPFPSEGGSRIYKTGDVARYLPDGVIEFCGRNDDQVKIRGFRIELGEVEAVLVQHEEVFEAAVVAREDTPGDKRLVAYFVAAADCQPTIDQLRAYLTEKLPDHMVPSSFVRLEKLPRNLNGKVDREALPAPDLSRPQLETPFVAPRNSLEETLAAIWMDVLNVKQVGIDDNFFALGGDSILSVQVLSKAQQEGLSFSLQSIFQQQTIRRLAEEIGPVGSEATLQTTPFSLISAEDRERIPEDAEDAYPLTLLQAGMIFHTEYHPDSAVYHSISSRRIRAKLDVEALRTAIQRIVEQHSVLRTSFHLHGFSEPLQVVHRSVVVPVTEDDLRHLEPAEQDRIVAEWLEVEKLRPYDWTRAPLLNLHLHRFTDDTFQWTFNGHHSLLDGWSDTIVFSDLIKRYVSSLKGEEEPQGVPPGVPYREFVALERQALESEETRNFWNDKLSDSVITPLPRWTSTKDGAELAKVPIPISPDVSDALKKITQTTGIPIKDVLLAAHMKVMSLLAGRREVMTGLISNGRPEMTDGERMVGLFLNTLPFRMKLTAGSWIDLAREVFEAEREILPHRRYPLARIQRDQGGQSLFETAFNFTHFHLYQQLPSFSEVEILHNVGLAETNFTLLLDVSIGLNTKIHAQLACNIAELQEEQVNAIAGYYATALQAMATDSHANHDEISLLSEVEHRQQLSDWNASDVAFSSDLTVLDLFEQQAERTPEAVAVVCDGVKLTYAELNCRANQLAHHLLELGVGPEQLVGVCMERSLEMVVALLGVLKAGGAYVPLDPAYPKERLAFMVEDAAVRVIVAQEKVLESLPEHGAAVVCLDADWERISLEPTSNPNNRTARDNSAYVIYTSGSTGKPKGVSITHRNILRLFQGTKDYFNFGEQDVWTLFHSYAFDFSVWELWGALLYGGKLVVVPYWVSRSPEAFYQMLRDEGVTVLNQTPSAFRQLSEVDRREAAELSLRLVIFGGEALELNSLSPWFEGHGEERPQLVNMYGITETTVHVTYRPLRIADVGSHSVIGRALPDLKVYVLDEQLRLLPVGVTGEMYVGGAGLGRGYLNRPELTADRFIPDPFSTREGARLYKTGDLARYLPNGDLVFAGRADDQVKLRGFRIELGEIEAALRKHSAVRDVVVHTPTDESGEMRLVAYVVTELEAAVAAAELRRHLTEKLPAHMVPQGFVVMDQLPVGHTGKIDRRGLPWPELENVVRDETYTAPRTPIEELVAGIWSAILGLDEVGIGDNFFALGGHSLLATQVITRVREAFKIDVPLRTLFESPTLAAFAEKMQALLREEQGLAVPALTRADRSRPLPLSFAQQRLWFIDQLAPGTALYNIPLAMRLRGPLDVGVLERALNEIVRRHEVLRTSFETDGDEPVQVIEATQTVELVVEDLSGLEDEQREARVKELAQAEAYAPFDLSRGPLLRARSLRLGAEEHVALLTMHHVISDGWSVGVMLREVAKLYRAFANGEPSPLPELELQYADYAAWQRGWLQGAELERQIGYWKEQLEGALPVLELPQDRPRPAVQTHRGAGNRFVLGAELSERVRQLSRAEGLTSFMVLLAAWQVLLKRLSGTEDISVGTAVAGRTQAEVEPLIGFFVNTLVLRTDLSGDPSFGELLERVRKVCVGAYSHQDVPFEKLVEELAPERTLSHTPLFQVMLVMQQQQHGVIEQIEGLAVSGLSGEVVTAKYDLSLNVHEVGGVFRGELEYNTDIFEAERAQRLIEQWQRVLASAVEQPQRSISELPLLSDEERQQLLVEWNDTAASYPAETTLQRLFEAQVERRPEDVALISSNEQISYRELNRRANQLAHHLVDLGVGPEQLVGVCVERSVEMVVAVLGVLKAGAAYLPLDPSYPKERLAFMVEDAEASVLLLQERLIERVPADGATVVLLDTDWERIAQQSVENLEQRATADNLAYVIYTSGSTGRPKGVQAIHRAVINRFNWMWQTYPFEVGEVSCMKTRLSFVDSVWELFGPMLQGVATVIIPDEVVRDPLQLIDVLASGGVSRIVLVPSLLRVILNNAWGLEKGLTNVKYWVTSGELLPEDLCHEFHQRLPGSKLINLYGSSEVSADATWYETGTSAENAPVPIGAPISNTQVYILDQQWQPAPVGVAGELYVGGVGLARGYWGQAGLTAERFVPDNWSGEAGSRLYRTGDRARYRGDGQLEFLGRLDHQVKIRGFRIELGEIEARLLGHVELREAVVVVRQEEVDDLRLVAYVVAKNEGGNEVGLRPDRLRRYLQESLPEYMVPTTFVVLPQLPLTPSGKIDRRALSELKPEGTRRDESPTGSRLPVEDILAGIWSEVLGLEQVEVADNFFDLGGHSLLLTQVASRVREEFGMEVSLRSLFEAPTLSGAAAVVQAAMRAEQGLSAPPIKPVSREIELPLSFAQQRLWIADQLVKGSPVYNLPAAVRFKGQLNIAALERSLNELIRRHETLRTSFTLVNANPLQIIASSLKLPLSLVDLSELPETSREAEARRLANEFLMAPFDLSIGPLLRAKLIRVDAEEHIALFVMHHIISDGWSMGVLVGEIAALYQAFIEERSSPLSELPVQYADFAVWQREWLQGEVLELHLDYWRRQLGPHAPELVLPMDRPRPPVQTHNGARLTFSITPEVQRGLTALSRREGVTMFMTLLAAFQTLLYRYSSQEDIIVGTDMANRNRTETENVIGFFVNMLVLRTDLSGNPTFLELLGRVRETALGAYAHQDLPFERLVEEVELDRDPSRNPLFQAVFVLQNTPSNELKLPGITLSPFAIEGNSVQFDLILSLTESKDGMAGVMAYNTDLFDEKTMSEMVSRYQTLLQTIVEDPGQRIADVRLTATDGLTRSDFPRADISQKDFENLLAQLATSAQS